MHIREALMLAVLAGALANGTAGAAPDRAPVPMTGLVLAGEYFTLDAEVSKRLRENGIELVTRRLDRPVSDAQLRLFDFVVLPDLAALQTPPFVPREYVTGHLTARQNVVRLARYVEEGGGVFHSPSMVGGGEEVAEITDGLLKPWGAGILAAQARDAARGGLDGAYAWTTAVAPSPVSEGVARLWYPVNMLRWDDAYATVPILLEDAAWTAVVRGMPESLGAKGINYTEWEPVPGQAAPVLAACRAVGKGRVAVLGVNPFYTLSHGFATIDRGWIGESNTGPVDGIFLERGDGQEGSDGLRLLVNMFRWLGAGARAAGLGGYDADRLAALPEAEAAALPAWLSWSEAAGGRLVKVLIGARSRASDGQATVAELAAAARAAGFEILVMTETFENLTRAAWQEAVAACEQASDDGLAVMPGFEIEDVYQNRYLCFGSRLFPDAVMLSPDRRRLVRTNYLSLGFGTHFTAIHRPGSTPMDHRLLKHYSGISVYTYDGKGVQVDDGTAAWEWQLANVSNPIPLVVHEVRSAAEVTAAAESGHQLYMQADTVQNAAWYLRAGMQHFWEQPVLFLVSEGPLVREVRSGRAVIEGAAPIAEVRLVANGATERLWRPDAPRAELDWQLTPSHYRWCHLRIRDANGRTALTPGFATGPAARYTWRCSDRQNWFGYAQNYTGTRVPDVDPQFAVAGWREGRGIWPGPAGANLCPLLNLAFAGPAVYLTDINIDQRYWRATWADVGFDAMPSQGTVATRLYQGRVRYHDFNYPGAWQGRQTPQVPMLLIDVELRLRMAAEPEAGAALFPVITQVGPQPGYGFADSATGQPAAGKLEKGWVDLPAGSWAGDLVSLTPGLSVDARGRVGFRTPPDAVLLPAGTAWRARYVRIPPDADMAAMRNWLGVGTAVPWRLELSRGAVESTLYVATLRSEAGGVAGQVEAAPGMPYALPLCIAGLNGNWPAAVWRPGAEPVWFGVFEGAGWARLDATQAGAFVAGNVLTAGRPELRMSILRWDAKGIAVEVNNPTAEPVQTTLSTPPEITGLYRLSREVEVPPGSLVRLEFGEEVQ